MRGSLQGRGCAAWAVNLPGRGQLGRTRAYLGASGPAHNGSIATTSALTGRLLGPCTASPALAPGARRGRACALRSRRCLDVRAWRQEEHGLGRSSAHKTAPARLNKEQAARVEKWVL